jgi:hypothetical protein
MLSTCTLFDRSCAQEMPRGGPIPAGAQNSKKSPPAETSGMPMPKGTCRLLRKRPAGGRARDVNCDGARQSGPKLPPSYRRRPARQPRGRAACERQSKCLREADRPRRQLPARMPHLIFGGRGCTRAHIPQPTDNLRVRREVAMETWTGRDAGCLESCWKWNAAWKGVTLTGRCTLQTPSIRH